MDKESLSRLRDALPGMAREVVERPGKIVPAGRPKPLPSRVCSICGRGFDYKQVSGSLPEVGVCAKCQNRLNDGEIACRSHDHYAFVQVRKEAEDDLADMKGKIIDVELKTMQEIANQNAAQIYKRSEGNGEAESN